MREVLHRPGWRTQRNAAGDISRHVSGLCSKTSNRHGQVLWNVYEKRERVEISADMRGFVGGERWSEEKEMHLYLAVAYSCISVVTL